MVTTTATTILDTTTIIVSYHLFCTSAMQMRTEIQSDSWQDNIHHTPKYYGYPGIT